MLPIVKALSSPSSNTIQRLHLDLSRVNTICTLCKSASILSVDAKPTPILPTPPSQAGPKEGSFAALLVLQLADKA